MSTTASTSAGTLIRTYLDAARGGDWDRAFGFFAEDMTFRIPGRSPFAGCHRGRDAAADYIHTARALAHDGDVEVELLDVLEGRDRVALLVSERFTRPEGVLEIRRANVYRVRDGEIVDITIFEADQYEVDALFAGFS